MFDQTTIESKLLAFKGVKKSYPFEKKLAVFSLNDQPFAIIHEGTFPLQLSLKCDPQLATLLVEKYETVMPTKKMDKRFWISLVLSGQLDQTQIKDLIRHAYELATA